MDSWRALMTLLRRLFIVLVGYVAAVLVAKLIEIAPELVIFFRLWADGRMPTDYALASLLTEAKNLLHVAGFWLLPQSLFVLALTEAYRIRSALYYAVFGALSAMAWEYYS